MEVRVRRRDKAGKGGWDASERIWKETLRNITMSVHPLNYLSTYLSENQGRSRSLHSSINKQIQIARGFIKGFGWRAPVCHFSSTAQHPELLSQHRVCERLCVSVCV